MNYLLYYTQPTKTTSIRRTTSIRKQLDALYGHFNTNTKTFTKIILNKEPEYTIHGDELENNKLLEQIQWFHFLLNVISLSIYYIFDRLAYKDTNDSLWTSVP